MKSVTPPNAVAREALEARFALRVAARLGEQADRLDADASQRLRFAREKALERAAQLRGAAAPSLVGRSASGAGTLGGLPGWSFKLASWLPLLVLAAGLLVIQHWHAQAQIAVAAEIDAELLADDLPPGAYTDAGFVEFLKAPRE